MDPADLLLAQARTKRLRYHRPGRVETWARLATIAGLVGTLGWYGLG